MQGTIKGTISFDPKTGIVKRREDIYQGTGNFSVEGEDATAPVTFKANNSMAVKVK